METLRKAVFLLMAMQMSVDWLPIASAGRTLSITVESLDRTVMPGGKEELVVATELGAMCLGNTWNESQPHQRIQLTGKTVDETGRTSWSWQVPKTGASGQWRIDLQCATSEAKGRLRTTFGVH